MNANKQLPFDVDDPEVQRACRAVVRWLLGDAEARRTVLAVLVAVMGEEEVVRTPNIELVACRLKVGR